LRSVIEGDDDDDDDMDMEEDDLDSDEYDEYEDYDDDMDDDDDFGDIYDDGEEDGRHWTSPAEFADVDMISPRRSFKGAKNMETVKDCELSRDLHINS
jgi:nuclear receptor interaction protein